MVYINAVRRFTWLIGMVTVERISDGSGTFMGGSNLWEGGLKAYQWVNFYICKGLTSNHYVITYGK